MNAARSMSNRCAGHSGEAGCKIIGGVQPRIDSGGADSMDIDPNLPRKVAVDRYRKKIRETEANRGEANYGKAAAVGALAGLATRFKNSQASHRAMIGAGAGLLAEGITRAAGAHTKDYYGERSRGAKKSEKIPIIAGLGVAGHQAYRRITNAGKKFKVFERNRKEIQFTISSHLRAKLITAAALAGGITAADAATRGAFPDDDETRKQAAAKGLKQGAIYGSVLAGSEPVLRKIAMKFRRQFKNKVEFAYYNEPYLRRSGITDPDGSVRNKKRFENYVTRKDTKLKTQAEDTKAQRRKLALYAGGAVATAGALALLAKRPAGSVSGKPGAAPVKPAGRGTLERSIKAKSLVADRGYIHMRPMMPGESKRFDKLPAGTKAKVGKFAKLAVHPELSPGEKQKFRQAIGKLRNVHRFGQLALPIEFSSFIKDVAFKDLPAAARKDVRAFHPDMPDDTLVAHYGMVAKELAGKADPHNLAAARKNVGKLSKKACADEVLARRGKKFVLLNNDQMVDGHHFLAKAERGRVTASLHVVDLTPSRFQGKSLKKAGKQEKNLQGKLRRAVEFARGDQLNTWTARAAISGPMLRKRIASEPFGIMNQKPLMAVGRLQHVHDDLGQGKRLVIPRGAPANTTIAKILKHDYRQLKPYLSKLGFQRKLRRAVEFGALDSPEVISAIRDYLYGKGGRKNIPMVRKINAAKAARRKAKQPVFEGLGLEARLRKAVEFMYSNAAAGPQGDLPPWVQQRRKNAKRKQRLETTEKVAGIAGGTVAVTEAALRLRKHLTAKAVKLSGKKKPIYFRRQQLREEESDRWADPRLVAIGEQKAYYSGPGNTRVRVHDLPVAHAQVLRKVYSDAGKIRRTTGRVASLLKDTGDVAAGRARRTDTYGRPQKREWEKPWFHRAATDAAIGAATVGGLIALKKSPKLRAHVMGGAREIKRKVNKAIPDFFAGRKIVGPIHHLGRLRNIDEEIAFAGLPIKGAKSIGTSPLGLAIRKARLANAWKKHIVPPPKPVSRKFLGSFNLLPPRPGFVRRALPKRQELLSRRFRINHPIEFEKIPAFVRSEVGFDDVASYAGWDVRDPRGRSARVFAPGSRRRVRREKDWHERVDNQRKLLSALAATGTLAGAGAGVLIGRKFPRKVGAIPKPRTLIQGPWKKKA
jgi:hypothetical protein